MGKRITAEDLNRYTAEQLKSYIYRTAKKANLDLRALEKAGASKGSRAYQYVEKLAFDGDIVKKNKKGQIYFTGSTKGMSRAQMLHKASEIANFKSAKTHTVAGVERAYARAYNTYMNRKAREMADEEAGGIGLASEAEILMFKMLLESQSGKNHFNNTWGAFTQDQYARAKRQSEQVASLIIQGYDADEISSALEQAGEERTLEEYIAIIKEGREEGGEEDSNPFAE